MNRVKKGKQLAMKALQSARTAQRAFSLPTNLPCRAGHACPACLPIVRRLSCAIHAREEGPQSLRRLFRVQIAQRVGTNRQRVKGPAFSVPEGNMAPWQHPHFVRIASPVPSVTRSVKLTVPPAPKAEPLFAMDCLLVTYVALGRLPTMKASASARYARVARLPPYQELWSVPSVNGASSRTLRTRLSAWIARLASLLEIRVQLNALPATLGLWHPSSARSSVMRAGKGHLPSSLA